MIDHSKNILTVKAGEGQSFSIAGGTYRTIISGAQTGGSYAVIDMLVPPGAGPGPHAHPHMQESFYMLEGEVEFMSEAGAYSATKGAFVYIPLGGMVHGFKNKSTAPAHLLCTVIPAGLEEFFQQVGKPVEAGTFLPATPLSPEELQKMQATAEKFGQKLYPPDYLNK